MAGPARITPTELRTEMYSYTNSEGLRWMLRPIAKVVGMMIACVRESDGVVVIVEQNKLQPI